MAGTPKWRGSSELQERPTSPVLDTSEQGTRWVRIFEGPYATCLSDKPARLVEYADLPGYKVDSTRVEKAPGNRGILTVTLVKEPIAGPEDTPDPVPEIEWVEVQKKLETHPGYNSGGGKALTDEDHDKINAWRNTTTAAERATAYTALSANAKHFADKVNKGIDSWNAYSPVARLTSYSTSKPATGGCGTRQSPGSGLAISGYTYVKTADRVTKHGRRWERVQEWTGSEYVDPDLYPA